jgi:hypothetical protein
MVEEVLLSQQSIFVVYMRIYRDGVDREVALSKKKHAIALLSKTCFPCAILRKSICHHLKLLTIKQHPPFAIVKRSTFTRLSCLFFSHELSDPEKDLAQP